MQSETPPKDDVHTEMRALRDLLEEARKELEALSAFICDWSPSQVDAPFVKAIIEKYLPKKEVKNENV